MEAAEVSVCIALFVITSERCFQFRDSFRFSRESSHAGLDDPTVNCAVKNSFGVDKVEFDFADECAFRLVVMR